MKVVVRLLRLLVTPIPFQWSLRREKIGKNVVTQNLYLRMMFGIGAYVQLMSCYARVTRL